jgi:hypothetical protein
MKRLNVLQTFCVLIAILLVASIIQACSCHNVTCYNGGECVDETCQCPVGYDGPHCEFVTCDLPNVCYTNSTCAPDTAGGVICVCNMGWEGDTCGIKICNRLSGVYSAVGDICFSPTSEIIYPPYNTTVTCSSAANRFIVEGLGGFVPTSLNIACIIQSPTTWIIDDTTFTNANGIKALRHDKVGTITTMGNKHKLSINYRVIYTDDSYEDCHFEMTQQ